MDKLRIEGSRFVDSKGREVLLRGVNLGGSSKMPLSEPTHIVNNFSKHREISFIGRPFPLEEAHEHYRRLRHWGFNVLRFLTTWEAIEHANPGEYDTEYLDYLTEVVALAGDYGFYVFIDPHQDVWSRMTGGDGAPGWTLETVGFDIQTLDMSEAAITMQRRFPDYPPMFWPANYSRLACNTMFTLFFAGNQFAPGLTINGKPIQDFLQESFINSVVEVAKRLKDMPHVLGYGSMNEPGTGYIGLKSLHETEGFSQQQVFITPAESILLGAGFAREVPNAEFHGFVAEPSHEKVLLNPHGISAWRDEDLWLRFGVWGLNEQHYPVSLKPDYFANADFLTDGLLPFIQKFTAAIRSVQPDAVIFLESTPTEAHRFQFDPAAFGACVNASHRYDDLMLFTKSFTGKVALDVTTMQSVHGRDNVAQLYKNSIAQLRSLSQEKIPTLIGEFGLAYDMNNQKAYQDGDFSMHELALSMYYDAMDANLVHSTQWNYTADNTHQWGDNWNQEDLSIFSRDNLTSPEDIHSGGRAIRGFSRPYVQRASGKLLKVHFDWENVGFTAEIDASGSEPSLIYVPDIWYGNLYQVELSSGSYTLLENHTLAWEHTQPGIQTITITR